MKKAFTFALALASFAFVVPAHAVVMGIGAGDLIKLKSDNNPQTVEDSAVYYLDKDWKRRPFPNVRVFNTWHRDYLQVKELSKEDMAQFRLGASILFRPGTRLVKIPSIPKVYALEPGGVLRWIETEAVAKALYGDEWAKRVEDVPESLFVGYREGPPIVAPILPTGTFVRRTTDSALFVIDGLGKRTVSLDAANAFRVVEMHVLKTAADLSQYPDLGAVNPEDSKYRDTAQIDRIETLPPPTLDTPTTAAEEPGTGEIALGQFRITSGQPVIIRKVTVTVTGPLWDGATPLLKDLKVIDGATGESVFGIRQLETPGATSETHVFSSALTLPENVSRSIVLYASPTSTLAKGAAYAVTFDRGGMTIADATNGNVMSNVWPTAGTLPTFTTTIK